MEKHINLVGILNIVYRSLVALGALFLAGIGAFLQTFVLSLMDAEYMKPNDVPANVIDLISVILFIVAAVILVISVLGIIGGIGVIKRREWARVLLFVISFLNLLHIPLGTALGAYTFWVLLNDDTIRQFKR